MTTNYIKVNGYKFESILHLHVEKEIWEHARAYVEGHIHETLAERILDGLSSKQSLTIKATDSSGEEKTIFNGLVEEMGLKTCNDMSVLWISGIGHTASLDIERKIRTFQDDMMTYQQVMEYLEQDMQSNYLLPQDSGKQIVDMLVQYKETNWEFVQRIASRLGTVVVPNATLDFPYVAIGIPSSHTKGVINADEFSMIKDINSFLRLKKNGMRNILESNTTCIVVKDRCFYNLCDKIICNQMDLLVYRVDIDFTFDELIATYILKNHSGLVSTEYWNERVIGASISGQVKEIQDDLVRVDLFNDVEQTKDKWFLYSTPYSSPDGTGWYFMPEIGDEIRLHFPTQEEYNGYVISSTHVTHGDRTHPEIKYIRTIRDQAITFYPDAIHIDDGKGSEILLDGREGIVINTDKNIRMFAQDNIELASQSQILMQGDEKVLLRQNDSIISIDDTIDITASHVRVQ